MNGNGNWAMLPNGMMGWALPSGQFMPFQPGHPFVPQMPQNVRLPVPGQGLLPGAPFPNPGQPQFFPPRQPSVSSAPSFPPGQPSAASFPSVPPTSFPTRAPSTASTSSFSPGPPSVASIPKAGNDPPRAWVQPKPKTADALCGDSFAIVEPEPKRPKQSPSPGETLELADEETPASQERPAQVCRLCTELLQGSVPPAFSHTSEQREHAEAHAAPFQQNLADMFPLCFPDSVAPGPEEREAGAEELTPSLPSDSKCGESEDIALPPPPPPPTTPPPASIPSTSSSTSTAPSSPSSTAPSSSSTTKTSKKGKKGAKLDKGAKSLVKKTKMSEVAEGASGTTASVTQSESIEDQAKVSTMPTTPHLKTGQAKKTKQQTFNLNNISQSPHKTATPADTASTPWSAYLAALASAAAKGGPCLSSQPRRGRKGRLPRCKSAIPNGPRLLERHLAMHLGKDLFRCKVPNCPSPDTKHKLEHNKSHAGSPKPDYEDLRPPLAALLTDQLEQCRGNKGQYAKKSAKAEKPGPEEGKSTTKTNLDPSNPANLNAPTIPKEPKKPILAEKFDTKSGDKPDAESTSTEKRALRSKASQNPDLMPMSSEETDLRPTSKVHKPTSSEKVELTPKPANNSQDRLTCLDCSFHIPVEKKIHEEVFAHLAKAHGQRIPYLGVCPDCKRQWMESKEEYRHLCPKAGNTQSKAHVIRAVLFQAQLRSTLQKYFPLLEKDEFSIKNLGSSTIYL